MKTFQKIKNILRQCIPIWSAILLGLFLLACICNIIVENNKAFADFLHEGIGVGIRAVLSVLTSWIPFSLAEFLLISSPILLTILIVAVVRRVNRSYIKGIRFCVSFLSLVSLVYTIAVFGYQPGFYGSSVAEKLELERHDLTPEQLYETSLILIGQIEEDLPYVSFPQDTYSGMTFSYAEMNDKLNAAYDTLCERYENFNHVHTNTKPVVLSKPWTYTHISGMYTFFTGEANVNVNYPDFIIISSAAHEMAHQRGINREDEANFVSYLVCSMSDDPYVRYCGNLDTLNAVMNKLYSASQELYQKAYAMIPQEVKNENAAYSKFFDQYRENVAADVSTAVNDKFISSNNQPAGVQSYGLVVDLVAAYLLGES